MSRGKLIVIEGSDGVGKDTVIEAVKAALGENNFIFSREPGGTVISEKIRDILLDKSTPEMDPMTEMLLYSASRAQHVREVLKPNLDNGINVLCNRYYHSTLIYQNLRGVSMKSVVETTLNAVDRCFPDLVISLYTNDSTTLMKRMDGRDKDRLELLPESFFGSANEGYRNLKPIGEYVEESTNKELNRRGYHKPMFYDIKHVNTSNTKEEVGAEVTKIINDFMRR